MLEDQDKCQDQMEGRNQPEMLSALNLSKETFTTDTPVRGELSQPGQPPVLELYNHI